MAGSEIQEAARVKLTSLFARISTVDVAHEAYLSSKEWPAI